MYKLVTDNKEVCIEGLIVDASKWILKSMDALPIDDYIAELPMTEGYINILDIYNAAVDECEDDNDVAYTGIEYIDGLVNNKLIYISLYDDDMDKIRVYTFTLQKL